MKPQLQLALFMNQTKKVGLPSYLQQVEYIECTSIASQYIGLGKINADGLFMETDMVWYNSGAYPCFLVIDSNFCICKRGGSGIQFSWRVNFGQYGGEISSNERHVLKFEDGKAYIDGECVWESSLNISGNHYIRVFNCGDNRYIGSYGCRSKIYYLRIGKGNGELLRDCVPCYATRDCKAIKANAQSITADEEEVTVSAGTAGLYDLVGRKFYVNAGGNATPFLVGADV